MAKINDHHIRYEPEWDVELTGQMHRVITTIQNSIATPERYAILTNFVHSIVEEWNRIRMDLDVGTDTRISKFRKRK